MSSGMSASAIAEQVRFPLEAMALANWLAEQSEGSEAKAVQVPALRLALEVVAYQSVNE